MRLVYDVEERPPFRKNVIYAFQQLLAIIAATLLVPTLVNLGTKGGNGGCDESAGGVVRGRSRHTDLCTLHTEERARSFSEAPSPLSTR